MYYVRTHNCRYNKSAWVQSSQMCKMIQHRKVTVHQVIIETELTHHEVSTLEPLLDIVWSSISSLMFSIG